MKKHRNFHIKKFDVLLIIITVLLGTSGCAVEEPAAADTYSKTEAAIEGKSKFEAATTAKGVDTRLDELTVHYMDVGQGDATLITCGEDAMLIDAGGNDKGTLIQSYLLNQNISDLDYVVGTHPDADHIGGLDVIITKFDCDTILLTEEVKNTRTYEDVISAIEYKGYEKTLPVPGDTYALGDASFTIMAPLQDNEDSNDNSIALLVTYGNTRFYFEGDAGETEEEQILSSGQDLQADVYKIGHHGSRTSTCDAMLAAVNPTYAVISAGEGNSYGHPHAEVLNKLRSMGIQTFRTDEQGTILAKSDGNTITFNMSSSQSWRAGEPGSVSDRETTPTDNTPISATAKGKSATGTAEDGTNTENQNSEIMVHITDTGEKYHTKRCRFLKESDHEISLEEAEAMGYTPCGVCHPSQ